MALVNRRVVLPEPLIAALTAHAQAINDGRAQEAERFLEPRALEPQRAVLAQHTKLRPFNRYEIVARARIGAHYIVKVRFASFDGEMLLQIRWLEAHDGIWRIGELDDLNARSPWTRPDKIATEVGHAGPR